VSVITSIHLQVHPYERAFVNRRWNCDDADQRLLEQAMDLLSERAWGTEGGVVRMRIDWLPLLERRRLDANAEIDPDADEALNDAPPVDVFAELIDPRENARPIDVSPFVPLFLHESFLMLNVAVPGSFGGHMRWSCGVLRNQELFFDARVFELGWVRAVADGWPSIEPLSLSDVKAWYDKLGIGTQQLATTGTASALFHLLYLARSGEDDLVSVLRLALALESLFDARGAFLERRVESVLGPTDSFRESLRRFLDDRDAMVAGIAPVAHPMYDDGLDARADDASLDYTEIVDFASSVIVGALQQQVRPRNRLSRVV
jgi:hypothetical protein